MMESLKEKLLERFLRYVSFDTQSNDKGDDCLQTYPSTAKQLLLLNHLLEEMLLLGLQQVEIDEHGYVMGTIPSNLEEDRHTPVIGLLAHVDTSPDMSGANVRPQIIENYTGGDVALGESDYVLRPSECPELLDCVGHTIITTDGTTLLGADDKAGVAEIMTMAEYLIGEQGQGVKHGRIRIGFTPDEEIGRGVDYFDVDKFGAKYAYTVDGGALGELEYENFNAAAAKIVIRGRNIHPGMAKGKMRNAIQVATELHATLPNWERPECTEGYDGFYHPVSFCGDVEQVVLEYIIRDHSREKFERKKAKLERIVEAYNDRYGKGTAGLEMKDQYYNMKEKVEEHMEVVELARQAMQQVGVKPVVRPVRGGTDGARLSFMGLPCPNLFTGGTNFHGRYEYVSLDVMEASVRVLIKLAELWARS